MGDTRQIGHGSPSSVASSSGLLVGALAAKVLSLFVILLLLLLSLTNFLRQHFFEAF